MSIALAGIVMLVIAAGGGALLARRPAPGRERQTKILLFVLYFWVLAFIELIVAGIGYALLAGSLISRIQ